jgi:hypothetical protein
MGCIVPYLVLYTLAHFLMTCLPATPFPVSPAGVPVSNTPIFFLLLTLTYPTTQHSFVSSHPYATLIAITTSFLSFRLNLLLTMPSTPCLSSTGLPLLYFHQLRQIRGHTHTLCQTHHLPNTTPAAHRLTCRGLKSQPGWLDWLQSEAEQELDSYATQGMFGTPCAPPPQAAIFHWVWIYKIKTEDNNRKKACPVCNGSMRGGHPMIAGHT